MDPYYTASTYAVDLFALIDPTRKIQAIKLIRSATKLLYGETLGLKESKNVVDEICAGTVVRIPISTTAEKRFLEDFLKEQFYTEPVARPTIRTIDDVVNPW